MSKELIISATRHETRVATLEDDQLVEIAIERASEHALAGNIYKGRVSRVLPGMQSAFVKIGLERDAFLYVSDVLDETAEIESGAADEEGDDIVASEKSLDELEEGQDRDPGSGRRRRGDRRGRSESAPPAERQGRSERSEGREQPERPEPQPEANARPERAEQDDEGSQRGDRSGRRGRRRRGRGGREGGAREGGSRFPAEKFASPGEQAKEEATPRRRPAQEDQTEARVQRAASAPAEAEDTDFEVLPGESLAKYSGRGFDEEDDDFEYETADDDSVSERSEAADNPPDDEEEPESPEDDPDGDAPEDEDDESEDEPQSHEEGRKGASSRTIEESSSDEDDEDDDASDDEDSGESADSEESATGGDEKSPAEQAEVREREGGRYLRRGRRGRRRGGRGRREPREGGDQPAEQSGSGEETAADRGGNDRQDNDRRGHDQRESPSRDDSRRDNRRVPAEPESKPEPVDGQTSIADLLKPGQEVIVQVAKEPLGKKGARITAHIALPGRHLVYMPTVAHVGVSRKIGSDAERARLRRVIKDSSVGIPGGFIVRTAGQGASDEELQEDVRFLANLWKAIQEKAERRSAPTMLHQDLDVVERFLRDQLGQNFKTIWVDSEDHYESIVQFVERFQPELLDRVKLYTRSKPIFDEFKITGELEKALRAKVWLKSGGYIVINQTEALVAIDVNTGKYVGKSDRLEDTIVKTNLEAVQEVVRQMRLRDLGGIIVVDFIDMDDRSNRKKVAMALEKEMRNDRAPSKALSFNDFGLVAITRKRVKQSLERALCSPCPTCDASGYVKSPTTVILEILNEVRNMAPKMKDVKEITLRVNPDVARVLKSRENTFMQEMEEVLKVNVLVRGDLSLHRENFDFTV